MRRDTEMGRTENFIVTNGLSQLYEGAQDVSPYSAFDDVLGNDNNDIEFSELASGAMRRSRRKFKGGGRDGGRGGVSPRTKKNLNKVAGYYPPVAVARAVKKNQQNRQSGQKGKVGEFYDRTVSNLKERRSQKTAENKNLAEQQKAIIDQVSKSSPTVEQLNALLATPTAGVSTTPQKNPMSKGLKIGLIVGGVVVAGVIAFVVYKKFKNKTK
jgi:hypothetical protein